MKPSRTRQPRVNPAVALAELTASVAPGTLVGVFKEHRRLKPALAKAFEGRGRVAPGDRAQVTRSLNAIMRWWGWIEPLGLKRIEDKLLLARLLDAPEVGPVARVWADRAGRRVERLVPVGDAPNWTGWAEGLKRFTAGRAVNADPWRLFPDWLRDELPVPPGEGTSKVRKLAFLASLQRPAEIWLSVRDGDPTAIWKDLREAGHRPWIHRRLKTAARLPEGSDVESHPAWQSGKLVAQDLASQAVGLVCDPDPGERWWDVRAQGGRHAGQLAALMRGKGTVIASVDNEPARRSTAQVLRHGPYRNTSTKLWDGKHPVGKPASFDGALIDAPCSGVGAFKRNPDLRWIVRKKDLATLAAEQLRLLSLAAPSIRPGGTLVYTALTATLMETTLLVQSFLHAHPDFRLQPFPHPLEDAATTGTLQLWPHLHGGDARFLAKFTRTTSTEAQS